MSEYLLSIDPGVSTGVALLRYTDETVPEVVRVWQFRDGALGLLNWIEKHWRESGWDHYNDEPAVSGLYAFGLEASGPITTEWSERPNPEFDPNDENSWEIEVPPNLTVIAEVFNPRGSGQGFSYTRPSLEPLVCEGVLLSKGLMDADSTWVSPPQQYFAGGKGKADKKKRQHKALRDLGYYVTGSMVDSPDADDARSCIAHALSYLSRNGHKPTYEMLSEWNERNK